MKRIITAGIALTLLACGTVAAKETLTVAWRGTGQELKALTMVADAFTKKTGIQVKLAPVEGDEKLYTMIISGNSPDLFSSVYTSGIYDYARRDMCEDLTPMIKRDKVDLTGFYAGAIKRLKFNGKQYGLPISGTPFTTWYNGSLLEQAGIKPLPTDWESKSWTWDDMVSNAVKLTIDKNGDGKPDQWGFGGGFAPENTCAWMWGGDFYPDSIYDTGLAKKSTVTSDAAIQGLQKWVDLKNKYRVVDKYPGWNAEAFVKGKIGIYQDSLHQFITAGSKSTLVRNGKFGVAILPVGTAPARPVIFTDPWLISKASKKKDIAWRWIKFATLEEGATIMANNYTIAPMSKKHLPEYFSKHGYINDIKKVTEGALTVGDESPNHTISNYPEINGILQKGMEKAFAGKQSPIEAMKSIESQIDAALLRNFTKYNKKK